VLRQKLQRKEKQTQVNDVDDLTQSVSNSKCGLSMMPREWS